MHNYIIYKDKALCLDKYVIETSDLCMLIKCTQLNNPISLTGFCHSFALVLLRFND